MCICVCTRARMCIDVCVCVCTCNCAFVCNHTCVHRLFFTTDSFYSSLSPQ